MFSTVEYGEVTSNAALTSAFPGVDKTSLRVYAIQPDLRQPGNLLVTTDTAIFTVVNG